MREVDYSLVLNLSITPCIWLSQVPSTRVYVGLCPRCAREAERAARLMADAHRRFGRAMAAMDRESVALRRNAELQVALVEARALIEYLRALGAGAEHELDVVSHERDVLQRAYVRLLSTTGSTARTVTQARRDLGLSA